MPPSETKLPLEVACFGYHNALTAQNLGAHRVELNAPGSYACGGLTPPVSELSSVYPSLRIPVRIMIRPSAPSFVYTNEDFEKMKQSITAFKDLHLMNPFKGDGFVFGILKPAPSAHTIVDPRAKYVVDVDRCFELTRVAAPYPCFFHRAFDPIADTHLDLLHKGLRDLVHAGFEGCLTAGGLGDHTSHLMRLDGIMCHIENRERLRGLQLIVGGGVREANAGEAVAKLGTHKDGKIWLHTACITDNYNFPGELIDVPELRSLLARLNVSRPEVKDPAEH